MFAESLLRARGALVLALASLSPLACTLMPAGNDEPPSRPASTSPKHGAHPKKHGSGAPSASSSAAAAASSSAAPSAPAAAHTVHLEMGVPKASDPSADYLMVKPQYALGYSQRRNVPNWVSWNLDEGYFGDAPRRKGKFLPDDSLPAGWYRTQDHDYAGSGYDRGHMVRSEERTRSEEDNTSTFYLTNVLPQTHELNAGPWLNLEYYCETMAKKERRELYLMAGGIFAASPPTIGHGVAVPDATFKIVVVLDKGQGLSSVTSETRVIAVIMPNSKDIMHEPWEKYRTTVAEIERRSEHRFLTDVPEEIRKALLNRKDSGPTGSRL